MKQLVKLSENEYKKMIRNQKLFDIGYFIDQKGIYNYISKKRTKTKDNMTLNDLAKIVKEGFEKVNTRLDKVETRLDNVENDIKTFKKDINTRLDGIVKVNNLKDSSKK